MAEYPLSSNNTWELDFYNWCREYPTGPLIWSTISTICFLVGFPASLWVLHELIQRQRQRSTSDIFMLSLAVVDLTFTALIPISLCNFMIWHIMELQSILNFIYSLSISGRPLFMACICWDCYLAVVHPIMYKTSRKLILVKKAITIIISFLILAGGFIIGTMTWLIATPIVAVPLIVALPVIAFCDISILQSLRKPDPTGNNSIHPLKERALNTISQSLIMTFVVYLPPLVIFSIGHLIFVEDILIFCCSAPYGFCFSTAGCFIMPVLYLVSVGKFDVLRNRRKK